MDQHDDEIWLVQLQNGAVRAMTLDELDAAYQEGAIDEETFVRRDGASKWAKLRDELGGDEPAAPPAPVPVPMPVAMATPTPAPVSYGAVPAYPQVQQQPLYSTRPVVSEIDMDELELGAFKKSRKGTYAAIAGVAVLAIGAMAFGASRMGASAPSDTVGASVANAVQPPPQVETPPAPQPTITLSDDQKKALADMDKTHEKTWEQKRKTRESSHASPAAWKPSHTPFHKGGNKYDPLNAKL